MSNDALILRQLLAGRDFATADPTAAQMMNFSYLIGSRTSRECVLVDPAWDVAGLLAAAAAEDLRVVGALVTHYHPDHVGGDLFGLHVEGVAEFLARAAAKVYVQSHEADGLKQQTGAAESDLARVEGGSVLELDGVKIEFLHTPGHTPGSQCFLVNGQALVSGDTLFVEGCGRVDLPGGDSAEMYRTLTERLAKVPSSAVLYPGHNYGPAPSRSLAEERRRNLYLLIPTLDAWLKIMNRR